MYTTLEAGYGVGRHNYRVDLSWEKSGSYTVVPQCNKCYSSAVLAKLMITTLKEKKLSRIVNCAKCPSNHS